MEDVKEAQKKRSGIQGSDFNKLSQMIGNVSWRDDLRVQEFRKPDSLLTKPI